MPVFRRRAPDPAVEALRRAFGRSAASVEAAQRALLAAIPTARDQGVPLAQALAAFAGHLDEARAAMDGWRDDALVHEWTKCADAIESARAEAARLRLEPGTLGFESLNARVGDVLHPLETFADVERALRRR